MSEVVIASPLSVEDARRLTERIRYTALSVRDGMEKLQRLVQEAKDGNAHVALGFASWTAYLSQTLGSEPLRLARDDRQALVGYLAGEGMSTRAIAPIVGTDHVTVARDLKVAAPVANATPAVAPPYVNTTTGEIVEPATAPAAAVPVTGLDGKTYTRPEPTEPRAPRTPPRRALTDAFFDAAYDMGKAIERVARLTADDRFPQNAEKVAAKHRSDLLRARDLLEQVINSLPTEEDSND